MAGNMIITITKGHNDEFYDIRIGNAKQYIPKNANKEETIKYLKELIKRIEKLAIEQLPIPDLKNDKSIKYYSQPKRKGD
jgi:hypothetical protein